jgi:hypothetical protein
MKVCMMMERVVLWAHMDVGRGSVQLLSSIVQVWSLVKFSS